MKQLIIINGVMGVGKTTITKELYHQVPNSVWLDGDWCWMMHPFVVNEETKEIVLDNITHHLQNFLNCGSFSNIFLTWVIDEEGIYSDILKRLEGEFNVHKITLMCSEETLRQRIQKDIDENIRDAGNIKRSLEKLKKYEQLESTKVMTDHRTIDEVVQEIKRYIEE